MDARTCLACLAIVAAGTLARPVQVEPTAVAEPQPAAVRAHTTIAPCAGLYAAVAGLSDYRSDGFSESNRQPTWQVILHCYRNDGWYAGTVLTGVNFTERPPTTLEVDYYAGRHLPIGSSDLNLEVLYTSFPNKRAHGPSYDFIEPQAELSRSFKALTLKTQISWSPEASSRTGQLWRLKGTASYALTPWLSISGHLGHAWIARGQDRTHWDVGATASWKRLSLDARYGGTNLKRTQCFFTDWCAPGASLMLAWRLLP